MRETSSRVSHTCQKTEEPEPPSKKMDEGARKWMMRVATKNLWRVSRFHDIDDLIQEGYLCWAIVNERYKLKTTAHQMALFKTIYSNRLHDLAKKQTRSSFEIPFTLFSDDQLRNILNSMPCDFAQLLGKIAEAKPPIDKIIQVMQSEEFCKPYESGRMYRETTHEKLCRLLNIPSDSLNLHKLLKTYLQST